MKQTIDWILENIKSHETASEALDLAFNIYDNLPSCKHLEGQSYQDCMKHKEQTIYNIIRGKYE